MGEIAQDLCTAGGVHHFGMELHRIDFAFLVGNGGIGGVF